MSGGVLGDFPGGSWECRSGDGTTGVASIPPGSDGLVALGLRSGVDDSSLATLLTTEDARKIAAALLELADRQDGETVLVFQPDCPTCTSDYPPGHPSRSAR